MDVIINISIGIPLAPLLIILSKRKRFCIVQKQLAYLICISILFQAISTILRYVNITNLPLFHIYPLIALGILSRIYQYELLSLYGKWLIPICTSSIITFSLFNSFFIQSFYTFSSNALTLVSAILIFYSLSYFYKLLTTPPEKHLESNPMFWINCAVIIYYSGSFIIFMYSNYMLPKSREAQQVLWGFHALFNIFNYLLYAVALWVKEKT